MRNLAPSPIDEETGLPNLILPYDTGSDHGYNYHHTRWPRRAYEPDEVSDLVFQQALDPTTLNTPALGKVVVRMARGQILPVGVHTELHNRLAGIKPPETEAEMFEIVVRECSGIASPWVVDLRRPDCDLLQRVDRHTFERITHPSVLCTERAYHHRAASYRRYLFGSFIMRYAIEQELDHVSGAIVREFVGTRDLRRRRELGGLILRQALDRQLEPIIPMHETLLRRGWVQPGKPDMRVAIRKLIPKDGLQELIPALVDRLQAAA